MMFPFESLSLQSREAGLVVAVLIGIGFGFVLERAGFGRATKLAAQFYFRDMTVFKVMFTAIVTAMLGLVAASAVGLADLRSISESIASWTWVWPMLAGGFVLGVGFILSGYCPGTSVVSAASGNVDGMLAVAGVVTGTFVYSEILRIPAVAQFHESGAKDAWFLYDLLPVSPATLAVTIATMAVLAFIGAEKVEAILAAGPPSRRWRAAVPAFAALAILILGGTIVNEPMTASPADRAIEASPATLAQKVIAEPWRYQVDGDHVVDLSSSVRWRITGGAAAWEREPLVAAMTRGAPVPSSPQPRPTTPFSKPKKKGGGCSA